MGSKEPQVQVPASPEVIARGYEPTTIHLKGFIIFLGAMLGLGLVVHLIIWGIMVGFAAIDARDDPSISPLANQRPLPPQPWLQPSPAQGNQQRQEWQDLARFRADEDQILNSYAVDANTGEARIPIARAMDLLLERGIPTAPGSKPRAINPEQSSSESSGGLK